MNKTKRKLQLASAIISIFLGAIGVIACIFLMATIGAIVDIGSTADAQFADAINQFGKGVIYAALIVVMMFGIALIICGSLMCRNPEKRNTEYKGLTITLLVLNSLMLISSIVGCTDASGIADLLLCLVNVGLLIGSLCIKGESKDAPNNETVCVTQDGQTICQEPTTNKSNVNSKIDAIRKLHEDGLISEEEMKTLILKELDK